MGNQRTDVDAILSTYAEGALGACTDAGREAYDDGLYSGVVQYLSACGGSQASAVYIAAMPADGSFVVLVQVQLASDADLAALDQIIATFTVSV